MNLQAWIVFLVLIFFHVPISAAAPSLADAKIARGVATGNVVLVNQGNIEKMQQVRGAAPGARKSVDRILDKGSKAIGKLNDGLGAATFGNLGKAIGKTAVGGKIVAAGRKVADKFNPITAPVSSGKALSVQDGPALPGAPSTYVPLVATTNAAKPSAPVTPAAAPVPVFKPTTFSRFTTGAATGVRAVANAHVNVNKQMLKANTLVVKGLKKVGDATGVSKVLDAAGKVNEAGKQAMIKANTFVVDKSLRAVGSVVAPVMKKVLSDPAANAAKPVTKLERAMATLLKPKLHETNQQLAWRVKRAEKELVAAKKEGNFDRALLAQQKLHDAHAIANQRFMRADEGGKMQVDGGLKSAAMRKKEHKELLREAEKAGYQPAIKELKKMADAKQAVRKRAEERLDAPANLLKESLGDLSVGFKGTKSLEQTHADLKMELKVAKERAAAGEPRRYDRELNALARLERIEVHLFARTRAVHGLETSLKELRTPEDFIKLKKATMEDAIKDPATPIKEREAYEKQLKKLEAAAQKQVTVAPMLDDEGDDSADSQADPQSQPQAEGVVAAEAAKAALPEHVATVLGYKSPAASRVLRPRRAIKPASGGIDQAKASDGPELPRVSEASAMPDASDGTPGEVTSPVVGDSATPVARAGDPV